MRTTLATVGTSLLKNAQHALNVPQPDKQELANYVRHTDPEKASAETNSLSRLLQPGDRIVFLHSQTEQSAQCAETLTRYFQGQGHEVDSREVPDLTYSESRFKMRGLRSLVATFVELIRSEKSQGRPVVINATGGFKAEIAYATLVGLLFDVPVYYIHEAFQDIIEMPPTPVSWDYSLLAEHEDFFEFISADLRPTADVDARLRQLPDEIRLLLVEEEGYTSLSPAGEAFYEAYRDRREQAAAVPIFLSEEASRTYGSVEPDVRQLFDRTFEKLRMKEFRTRNADRVGNCDCLVFPKGHRSERVFFYEGEDGSVRICELARHSDKSYEKLMDRGVHRKDYRKFKPWPWSAS